MVNSRSKGIRGEQDLARYLRAQGHPFEDAQRRVHAGWSNAHTDSQDRGDLQDTPGLCFQVKNQERPLIGAQLESVWRDVRDQARPGELPIIVEKRTGQSDPARWYAWLSASDYIAVVVGQRCFVSAPHLVRVELGDIIDALRLHAKTQVR